MNKLFKKLYEHLEKKENYNNLENDLEIAREDNKRIIIEMGKMEESHKQEKEIWKQVLKEQENQLITDTKIYEKKQYIWEKRLEEQEEEIIKLKEEIKKLKSKKVDK